MLSYIKNSALWGQTNEGTLIDGKWESSDRYFVVKEKYTNTKLASVGESTVDQISRAVSQAQLAVNAGAPEPSQRAEILRRVAKLVESRSDELRELCVAESGMTLSDADVELRRSIVTLNLSAEESTRIAGDMVPFGSTPGSASRVGFTIRKPVGIVCAITPFNSPINVVLHKVAPALAAGNSVILKPSPLAPLSAIALAKLFLEAGLPKGMLSIVNGEGADVGEWLVQDERINFYTFTGSTKVGRAISEGAGLRNTQLELGSIASTILCEDADLDYAIPKIVKAAFRKAGQVCTSTQRLYVETGVLQQVIERLKQAVQTLVTGNPFDVGVDIGPMISPADVQRVQNWITEATESGAELLSGGRALSPTVMEPTVLTGVSDGSKVLTSEVFAPVLVVESFDDISEVIRKANDTPFGLSCGIFTSRAEVITRAVSDLDFGAVHINETSSARADEMPFGGVKASGHGKEGPYYAVREYTTERLVTWNF